MSKLETSDASNDTKKTLRYMQVAAVGALVLIGAVIYTFAHLPVGTTVPADTFPTITVTAPYRQKVPHFEWRSGDAHLKSSDLQGSWTLLSFWSMTCAPCLKEMPDLDQFNEDWSGPELSIVTVNEDTAEMSDTIRQFVSENEIQLPVYYDVKGEIKEAFAVHEFPRHFLISPKGEIVWTEKGAFNWTDPESQKSLLAIMEREGTPPDEAEGPEDL
jgi:thiol-disulfide isomerase/thioredoxin